MMEVLEIAGAILASVGSAGAIILGLSTWLGKIWANRIMLADRAAHDRELERLRTELRAEAERQQSALQAELDIFSAKHLGAHVDKLAAYRFAVDLVAGILAHLTQYAIGLGDMTRAKEIVNQFEQSRLKLYGYLAMLAPQEVMDAQDALMECILEAIYDGKKHEWREVRELALVLINEIRKDIGVDPRPIAYRGSR
jgi:hypothetical protein